MADTQLLNALKSFSYAAWYDGFELVWVNLIVCRDSLESGWEMLYFHGCQVLPNGSTSVP